MTTAGARTTLYINLNNGSFDGQTLTLNWVSDLSQVNGGTGTAIKQILVQARLYQISATGAGPNSVFTAISNLTQAQWYAPPGQTPVSNAGAYLPDGSWSGYIGFGLQLVWNSTFGWVVTQRG